MMRRDGNNFERGQVSALFSFQVIPAAFNRFTAVAFNGDKSPADSADKSTHSKAWGRGVSRAVSIGVLPWLNCVL